MQSRDTQAELAEMAEWICEILVDKYAGLIREYLKLPYEVGGRINLDYDVSKFFQLTKEGTETKIESQIFP